MPFRLYNLYLIFSNRYQILQCGDVEKLIRKRKAPTDTPLYYSTLEDSYDVLKRAHTATGHGGRDRMLKELSKKYANITCKAVEFYKSHCVECQKKRKRPMTKGVVVNPILTKEFASRCQVDLIDMQSLPSDKHKWIMVYQDHLTKFCVLRALTSKRASEVAYHLMDIFVLLGAPIILQSDNGSEFTSQVISELKDLWPDLTIVYGKPRYPQSQGSVERANGDIKDMLIAWMSENNTQDWTIGIKFVQFQKNTAHHAGIKCSPYSALFGCDARIGLTSTSLPQEIIERMQSEDDLIALVTAPASSQQPASPGPSTDQQPASPGSSPDQQPASPGPSTDQQPASPGSSPDQQPASPGPSTDQQPASPGPSTDQQPASPEPPSDLPSSPGLPSAELPPVFPGPFADLPSSQTPASSSLPSKYLPDSLHPVTDELSPVAVVEEHKKEIKRRRIEASAGQLLQAERMVKRSHIQCKPGSPGDNVAVPIPSVDRGRGDPRNILGVILYRDKRDQYRIAVKSGILKGLYSRNQFDLCPQKLLTLDHVNQEQSISLRSAVIAESTTGGQGFAKCNCQGSKKCQTMRCKCFKARLQCNSRCHSSLNCPNK